MKHLLFLFAALLVGCAAYNQSGIDALNRGDLVAAEQHFSQGVAQGDPMSINNMGVVYERRGNLPLAISHYTLAARYGVPLAGQNLARLNQPIPSPDLANARAQRNAADSAATADFLRALSPPPRQGVNCTSYRIGNTVQTDCR